MLLQASKQFWPPEIGVEIQNIQILARCSKRTSFLSKVQFNTSHTLIAFECVAVVPHLRWYFYSSYEQKLAPLTPLSRLVVWFQTVELVL